jgi:hypothetical protein
LVLGLGVDLALGLFMPPHHCLLNDKENTSKLGISCEIKGSTPSVAAALRGAPNLGAVSQVAKILKNQGIYFFNDSNLI